MIKVVLETIIIFICFKNIHSSAVPPFRANSLSESTDYNHPQKYNTWNRPKVASFGSYAFGYDVEDSATNNVQFKNEERHENGSVTGSYGYLQPDGNVQKVSYVADQFGYRASVEIVPRGVLKPIQIFRPETHLLDFSSNLPASKNIQLEKSASKQIQVVRPIYDYKDVEFSSPLYKTMQQTKAADTKEGFSNIPYPYNVPNYISKHLEKPKYRMERGFVPYFPEKQKNLNLYQNLLKDYYVIPLQ